MVLNIREAAALLNVTPDTLHQWIKTRGLPAHRVREHYRFNQSQLLEWATAEGIPLSPAPSRLLMLTQALERGGIVHDLPGKDMRMALKELVGQLPLPPEIDRIFLLRMLLARERLGSTGIGEGIAVPHVRNPIVLRVPTPLVSLAFLRQPVDFHALDGKPVSMLFTLVTPTVRMHLTLLSRLAFVLHDAALRNTLHPRAAREMILKHFSRIELQLQPASETMAARKHQS
ncbi:MAG: PTS sugar transporter subunit IIA [Candidatus Omnitrophica bacterium]|nr:PTS sugar transporter subunit IIA [Candidatus Omnitrophota bacterium]